MKLYPRLLVLAVCLLPFFLLTNCEKGNAVFLEDIKQEIFKTVSISEAKDFLLTKQNDELFAKSNNIGLEFDTNLIDYEELSNSSEKLMVIPATTNYNNHYSRVLLLNINGTIESVLFALYPNPESTQSNFSGEIMITDLEGNFKNGYRVEDNVFITQFVKENSSSKSTYANYKTETSCVTHGICASAPNECIICSVQEIGEVTIQATQQPTEGGLVSVQYIYSYDHHNEEENTDWNYTGGGGSSNASNTSEDQEETTCGEGTVLDENGECAEVCVGEGKVVNEDGECVDESNVAWPYPHCSSFEYANRHGQKIAAVFGMHHTFYTWENRSRGRVEHRLEIQFPTMYFNMPSYWTNGRSATETAKAINRAFDDTREYWAANPTKNELVIHQLVYENIKKRMLLINGNVSTNDLWDFVGTPSLYRTNVISTGNCDI